MAGELVISISAAYSKNGQALTPPGLSALSVSVSGNTAVQDTLATSTVEAAIPLGGVVPRWAFFKNLDSAIAIKVKASNGGTVLCTLLAGEEAAMPLDSTITAPTALAASGTPLLAYALFPA